VRLCILINDLDFFNLPGADPLQNDGTYAASALLRRLIGLEWVESVEIYLPSHLLVKQSEFSNAIRAFLPRERRGKGTLNVYPVHSLPDVWTDRVPRAILSVSPECMPRDRYLRDRFACGPAVVLAMAFTLGEHRAWASLRILADSLPTKFDSIVSPTAALLEAYHKAFVGFLSPDGNIPCRLDLLAQPVDTEKFAPADSAIRARARLNLNLPLDAVVTLFLGRLTAHDKADLIPLIRCFAQTSTSADEYLLIVGTESSSSFAARLREFGDSLGLADRLIIRTNISAEMRSEYYAASDIFVFTCDGIQEACTVTVVEAMASGLPVIVSDWAGLGCLVVNGETGYCIPTFWLPGQERVEAMSPASLHRLDCLFLAQSIWGDTEVLSERLRRLLASPPLRPGVRELCRSSVGMPCCRACEQPLMRCSRLQRRRRRRIVRSGSARATPWECPRLTVSCSTITPLKCLNLPQWTSSSQKRARLC
jgi:glycosyltransferase involved in cell wall biosynthesis